MKEKCLYCNKEFFGYSKKQVDLQIEQHIISKHREKIDIESLLKNLRERNESKERIAEMTKQLAKKLNELSKRLEINLDSINAQLNNPNHLC